MPYLIDEILPTNRVHLLGGVSDAGKTRWVIPAMLDWEAGQPVLGRPSHPVPWLYIAGDRTIQEVHDSMQTMSIPIPSVRVLPAFGSRKFPSWVSTLDHISKMTPRPELLVWEGFGDLCGESKSEVAEFLASVSAFCEPTSLFPRGLTVLGVVESPKQKPYERYPNPRQRISGVSSWSYHTSTIILIEGQPDDLALETERRDFWICSKNAKRRKLTACFDPLGRLIVP